VKPEFMTLLARLGLLAMILFCLLPIGEAIGQIFQARQSAGQAAFRLEKLQHSAARLAHEQKVVIADLEKLSETHSKTAPSQALMQSRLNQMIRDAGGSLDSIQIKPVSFDQTDSRFSKLEAQVNWRSNEAALTGFIDAINSAPDPFVLSRMTVQRRGQAGQDLSIRMTISGLQTERGS